MTNSPDTLVQQLSQFLTTHLKPNQRLLLALSGGLDSTVLLHLLLQARAQLNFELQALHVHHGLSANADAWAETCTTLCRDWQVPLEVVRIRVPERSGLGVEAAARQQRYQVLFDYQSNGQQPDWVVTAHHQDDQAETLLLQLFRGAGVKGLASMAVEDSHRRLLRPLLDTARANLEAYAKYHKLTWCEDESNLNTDYDRNFVRHEVLPALAARYPAIKPAIARTAAHLAEASQLLDELAAMDVEPLWQAQSLDLQGLASLPAARTANGLRWWLAQNDMAMPNREQLQEILRQLFSARADAQVSLTLQTKDLTQTKQLKRYRQRAYLVSQPNAETYNLRWQGEPELMLSGGECLLFKALTGSGIAKKYALNRLTITTRKGGERFKPDARKPTRTLKHLLQEAGIPPWQRERQPLLYLDDVLVCVPGIGVAHDYQASEDEPGLGVTWLPSSS